MFILTCSVYHTIRYAHRPLWPVAVSHPIRCEILGWQHSRGCSKGKGRRVRSDSVVRACTFINQGVSVKPDFGRQGQLHRCYGCGCERHRAATAAICDADACSNTVCHKQRSVLGFNRAGSEEFRLVIAPCSTAFSLWLFRLEVRRLTNRRERDWWQPIRDALEGL